jgi:hypothetical protein
MVVAAGRIVAGMPGTWTLQTWLLAFGIVLWAVAQYGLAYWTLRDLSRRPRVRGDNKVLWALLILTVPLVGALLYTWMGPTSFLPRPTRAAAPADPATDSETTAAPPSA